MTEEEEKTDAPTPLHWSSKEEQLQFQSRLLDAIGQAVIATTPDGTIISWNRAAEALYGWSAAEAIGQPVIEMTVAEAWRTTAAHVMTSLAQGERWSGEFPACHRSGYTFPAFGTTMPIHNNAQHLIGLISISSDTTEQKRMEQILRESEARYRTLVETSPSAIFLTDVDGTIRFCNAQAVALFGYRSADELCGTMGITLVDPSMSHIAHVQLTAESGNTRNVEYRIRRKDGSQFPAEISSSIVTDAHGRPTALIIVVHDISTRKLLQARLIENERFAASGRLLASVAHELNNPLQAIQSSLSMVEKAVTRAEREQFLTNAKEEIRRAGTIVRQLLDLYRPCTATPAAIDVNALIERILLLMGKRLKDTGVTVTCSLMPNLPAIWGRADEITQVLFNLINNAIEAMPDGGTLRIDSHVDTAHSASPTSITITISDTGSGIAPDLLSRIFEPFMTTKEHGTGQGLTISDQIIAQHEGRIAVESWPGKGSTFRIVLPICR